MIFADLQTFYNPWLNRRALKRLITTTKKQSLRLVKANVRKAKTNVKAIVRRQYFVTNAYADFQTAVRRNEDIFLGTLMVVLGVGFSFAITVIESFLLFFTTAYELSAATGIDVGLLTAVTVFVLAVLGVWVSAFLTNMQSIALMQGATGKKYRSLRQTIRSSLRNASRISSTWFMLGALLVGPLMLAVALGHLYMSANPLTIYQLFSLVQVLIVVAITWIVLVIINFGLAPYAALYEPGLSQRQAFTRSAQLVRRRGRIFILTVYGLLGLVLLSAYKLSELINSALGLNSWLSFSVLALGSIVVANGLLAVLYRKRKLARKY